MASYKYKDNLAHNSSDEFDKERKPGEAAPFSGIYRCMSCEWEVASNERQPLPPQNHHVHPGQQPVRWKLIVFAQHKAA